MEAPFLPEKVAACGNCRAAHKGCPKDGPPCGRCIDCGLEDTCFYVPKPSRAGAKGGPQKKIRTPVRRKPPKYSRERIRSEDKGHSRNSYAPYFASDTVLQSFPRVDAELIIINEETDQELRDLMLSQAEVGSPIR